jgi:hypothetical protein
VLVDGRPVGLWRQRKRGTRLDLAVEPLTPLSNTTRSRIVDEARGVGLFLGYEASSVTFVG